MRSWPWSGMQAETRLHRPSTSDLEGLLPRQKDQLQSSWRMILTVALLRSAVRGLPEITKTCCDRRIFICCYPLDILLKAFEILKGLGTTRIPQYGHLVHRISLLTKLTEDSNEVRAGRPKILVLPEGLP